MISFLLIIPAMITISISMQTMSDHLLKNDGSWCSDMEYN